MFLQVQKHSYSIFLEVAQNSEHIDQERQRDQAQLWYDQSLDVRAHLKCNSEYFKEVRGVDIPIIPI
jgi:hypothetical protein